MKRSLAVVAVVLCCFVMFSCSKSNGVIAPYLTASVPSTGADYTFNALTVTPSVLDTQTHDTTTMLIITATSADPVYQWDKMVLSITKYRGLTGTFSIDQGFASAYYLHAGVMNVATGGIVSITQVAKDRLIGYFSFQCPNATVSNGSFNVDKPTDLF